jgi:hypothetical protein
MSAIKCYDVASMVIEDANERFAPIWKPNTEFLQGFEMCCDAIDIIAQEFGGITFDVEVNEDNMEITVALECDEIMVENDNHILYKLIKRTIRYGFSASEDGNLLVSLVFPGIWSKS